jgi:hypothetical protein
MKARAAARRTARRSTTGRGSGAPTPNSRPEPTPHITSPKLNNFYGFKNIGAGLRLPFQNPDTWEKNNPFSRLLTPFFSSLKTGALEPGADSTETGGAGDAGAPDAA